MPAELMRAIELHRFSGEVNLAAGTKTFRRSLRNHALFRELADLAKEPHVRTKIAERVATLSRAEIDAKYENPFDAALSAYLTVLGDTAEPEVVIEAASAAASAPNCWWTVGISRELLIRAVATGHVQSAHVWAVDTSVLMSGWKETLAENYRQWFDQQKVHNSAETYSLVFLRLLSDAQSMGQQSASLVLPPQNDRPVVSLNPRRRNKNRPRPAHGGTVIRHRSRMARASQLRS